MAAVSRCRHKLKVLHCTGAKPAKAAPSPPPAVFPQQWDASLDSLEAVQQQLAAQDGAAGDRFRQRIANARQGLLVAQHRQILHRHAVRLLVQQAADSIDTAAESVKQVKVRHAWPHDL